MNVDSTEFERTSGGNHIGFNVRPDGTGFMRMSVWSPKFGRQVEFDLPFTNYRVTMTGTTGELECTFPPAHEIKRIMEAAAQQAGFRHGADD